MKSNELPNKADRSFKVPENYFQELDAEIFAKIDFEKSIKSSNKSGFIAPSDYFENIDQQILERTRPKNPGKVVSFFSLKNVAVISGIAASLLIFITLVFTKVNPLDFTDIETASIESYLFEKDINTYEMAQILELNNIDLYDVTGSDLTESTLEDYLFENATLDDLYQQ